jgi:hypothetical protein
MEGPDAVSGLIGNGRGMERRLAARIVQDDMNLVCRILEVHYHLENVPSLLWMDDAHPLEVPVPAG